MIEYLKWDSDFFKLPVYRIDKAHSKEDLQFILADIPTEALVYLFCAPEDITLNNYCQTQFKLVDRKVTFSKELRTPVDVEENGVVVFDRDKHGHLMDDLYELAYLSGHTSRFKVDDQIPKEKFMELYRLWIDNTINKNFGLAIYIALEDVRLSGFVTINRKGDTAHIGLIAVHPSYQGKSIGSKLLRCAEQFAIKQGLSTIFIPTQLDNKQACSFYEKNGYTVASEEWIYHIWL